VREGASAEQAVADASKRTTSRRDLARNPRFEQISPEVGELDEAAIDEAMQADADEALALLADLTSATDPVLRDLARRLAGRLMLDVGRRGPVRPRGIGRLVKRRYRDDGGELDVESSLEAIVEARALDTSPAAEDLWVRTWGKPATALCLLVDRSGSMGGKPLATSAVAAASVAWRSPEDYSVLAFGKDVVVAKSQDAAKANERVVNDVLALRGFGTTDLAGALRAAHDQLARTSAGRKVTIVLSDCRATVDGDPIDAARGLDEVVVIAPIDDDAEARVFADRVGARLAVIGGPSDVPDVLNALLDV
jgi:hypothetical protein